MAKQASKKVFVDGIFIPNVSTAETFRVALDYKARQGDVFIYTYPKSGTTWAEVILYTLMHNGEAFDENISKFMACTPYLEIIGEQGIYFMYPPYTIKTHLPFTHLACDPKAKYVCVIRNPKDVCVSYYYFNIKISDEEYSKASFDAFFEDFINGALPYGDYFEHLKSVWKLRNKSNVLLISYEEMKHDLRAVIRRIAQFMNIKLNDDLLERVAHCASFDYMKKRFDKACIAEAQGKLADESFTVASPNIIRILETRDKFELVRAGVNGGWSATMSEEQAQRLDKNFLEKTKDMPGLDRFFSPQNK